MARRKRKVIRRGWTGKNLYCFTTKPPGETQHADKFWFPGDMGRSFRRIYSGGRVKVCILKKRACDYPYSYWHDFWAGNSLDDRSTKLTDTVQSACWKRWQATGMVDY